MIVIGTIFHIFLGLLFRLISKWKALVFAWPPIAIAAIFAAKEVGEAKYKIPGSIASLDKNIEMILYLGRIEVLPQWVLPGLAVAIFDWYRKRKE